MYPHKMILPVMAVLLSVLAGSCLPGAATAEAQTPGRVSGELMAARGATINGLGAVSGQTVFNNNRVRTGNGGQAVISLGPRGRMEIGPEADLTVKLLPSGIGGEIRSGSIKLSAPTGVPISIVTPKGLVTAGGLQGSILQVEIVRETTRITSMLGESQIVSGPRIERLPAGEELAITQTGWKRRFATAGLLASAGTAATTLGGSAQAVANAAPQAAQGSRAAGVFADLLNNSVNYTLNRLAGSNRGNDPIRFFDTTITCRDHDNIACRRRSGPRP